jgi:predicted AlkP superfamily pyrophosphatase or phosphodiesterase
MLPSAPKSLGRLGDVLISALKAALGEPNALNLPAKRSVCVILVDGLGAHNLKNASAHASYLNSLPTEPAMCWFPATTAVSITAFASASNPWSNGFLGYQVFNTATSSQMNLLSGWKNFENGQHYQKLQTVAEMASSEGISFHTVAPAAYERSGFTAATMRGSLFHGVNVIDERFERAKQLLNDPEPKVVYLYIPELDQIAHAQGSSSNAWISELELVDSYIRILSGHLTKSAGILVTSDHGVIDVDKGNHIFLDELISGDDFKFVGGDTRALYLYFKDGVDVVAKRALLEAVLGDSCYIVTTEDLIAAGYWGSLNEVSLNVSPDLLVLAKKQVALYHRDFAKAKSLNMIGHHGSLSSQELTIPLIKIGF